jgi:hypothetical protein
MSIWNSIPTEIPNVNEARALTCVPSGPAHFFPRMSQFSAVTSRDCVPQSWLMSALRLKRNYFTAAATNLLTYSMVKDII